MRKQLIFTAIAGLSFISAACSAEAGKQTKAEEESGSTLHFYTSQPDADAQALVAGFNKQYPDVSVQTYRSGTEEVVSKLQAENQAGNIQADVLLLADAVTFEGLKEKKWLMPYQSSEADDIPEEFIDPDDMYTGTKIMATALVVNTAKDAAIPTSWSVLTDPETKNQSIMPSPFYSGAAAYNLGVFTRQPSIGWAFYKDLKGNGMTVAQGNGGVLEAVASGEKSYGMVVDFVAARAKKEGSPVELVYPKEGVPVITEPIGIVEGTEAEEAAKLFVDFVLSEEGQKIASEVGYTPIKNGIKAPEGLKTISQMNVLEADPAKLYTSREADKNQFGEIFGQE